MLLNSRPVLFYASLLGVRTRFNIVLTIVEVLSTAVRSIVFRAATPVACVLPSWSRHSDIEFRLPQTSSQVRIRCMCAQHGMQVVCVHGPSLPSCGLLHKMMCHLSYSRSFWVDSCLSDAEHEPSSCLAAFLVMMSLKSS